MGHTLGQYEDGARARLGDRGVLQRVRTEQFEAAASAGVAQFSADWPRHVTRSYTGDGTVYEYDLADTDAPFATTPVFVARWSNVVHIECPTGERPPVFLQYGTDYVFLGGTKATTIQLQETPSASDGIEVTYTAPWPYPTSDANDDPIPDLFFDSVCAIIAAEWIEAHIRSDAQRKSNTVAGESVTVDTSELRDAAALLRRSYESFVLGRSEIKNGRPGIGYATTVMDAYPGALFHP